MSEPTSIIDMMDDDEARQTLEHVIMLMRLSVSRLLNEQISDEQFRKTQSCMITAGMTCGHMLTMGALDEKAGDLRQARKMAVEAFDAGVQQGKIEAHKAMVQSGLGGNA